MNSSDLLDGIRIGAQLAVGEKPKCPPGYCARLATCEDLECPEHGKTGWPAPELAQDDHRGLFRWFASKPDARRLVRERVAEIEESADTPLATPEQAESWTATTGYTLIAALAGVLFLIFLVVLYMRNH